MIQRGPRMSVYILLLRESLQVTIYKYDKREFEKIEKKTRFLILLFFLQIIYKHVLSNKKPKGLDGA